MYIEKMPKSLLNDITTNRCIPFIGAGFSKNANSAEDLYIPDWNGLGKKVSEYLPNSEYDNPIEALSQYEAQYSRANLIELIANELHINEIYPGEAHLQFCRLYFDIICTTNFDFLLENAYSEIYSKQGKPYHVITNENRLSTFLNEKTTILKLHGDFSNPAEMVITENDYDMYIARNPLFCTYIANLLITRTPLLIGYSLNDPDLRMLWSIIGSRLNSLRRTGYAILCSASESDVVRFKRRGISVINLPVKKTDYSKALTTLFAELLDYWDKQTGASMETSNEDAISTFKFSEESQSELCFFSVPYSRLSLYKRYIFPIAKKYGLIPVAADDFILPGENISAKINTLIQKSTLIIADLSSNSASINMELGIIREKNKPYAIITSPNSSIAIDCKASNCITGDFENNIDTLLDSIETFIRKCTDDILSNSSEAFDEPKRLYDLKEYNAAVISAIRLLEINMTKYWITVEKHTQYSGAVIPLAQMIRIIGPECNLDVSMIKEWSAVRNRVVHSEYNVSRAQCKNIVDGVYQVIKKLS